ncbi:MAG: M1 family aminopeptidase [Planctomycetota bacterium]
MRYWLRSMMVYVFLDIIMLLVFAATASDNVQIGGALGNANRNSPFTIQMMYSAMSTIAIIMTAAFVNGAASRDFQYNTHQLIFTKPIGKLSYVMGRFCGSVLVAILPMLGVSLGILLASGMPWNEPENWGPIYWSAHFWGLLALAIPNTLIVGALLFAVAVYTRSTMAAFISAIVLLVGSSIAGSLVSDIDNRYLAALIDPFGSTALEGITRYWTVADRNTQVVALSGTLLVNRIFWLTIGAGAIAISCWRFSFTERHRGSKQSEEPTDVQADLALPPVSIADGLGARLVQLRSQVKLDFFETIKSNVFVVLSLVTLINMFLIVFFNATEGFGIKSLPVTYRVIDLIRDSMYAPLLGIIAFYTGVMVWKERDAKLDEIYDALPQSTWTIFLGKLIAIMLIIFVMQSLGIITAICVQLAHGYTRFQFELYISEVYGLDLLQMFFIVLLSMVAHVISPNKYIGYFAFILLVVANSFGWQLLEVSNNMLVYGGIPQYVYSDMFGYAPFLGSLSAFALYWGVFSILVIVGCVLYWQRGKERSVSRRMTAAARNFRGATSVCFGAALGVFLVTAAWVYLNTSVRNEVPDPSTQRLAQASYEKEFKEKHSGLEQPHIIDVKYAIDVFPERRAIMLKGEQKLVNRSEEPIKQLFLNFADGFETEVNVANTVLEESYDDQNYYIYRFDPAMEPGQELDMSFSVSYENVGFENSVSHQEIVQNGTFFNNQIAPIIGYQSSYELSDKQQREEQGLEPNPDLMPPLNEYDQWNRAHTYLPGATEWIDVETVISTTNDYAVAPGSLVKRWEENGRNYFQYKLDHPSLNFYSFISADYKVAINRWKDVDIEVYYHPEHEWNVENMLRSIRDSLEYYSENFGPYKHKQARIIEFPRIAGFAQAFPGTMPYSEGIGFIADISGKDDIDMVYYVVAHEMAHQWWAHQVVGANMQGATLLSETLAQYSALMVMEKQFGRDTMRKFLQYEMDGYLRQRGQESLKERPLIKVESSQGYIHYQKGSCAMYYLKEMIGEGTINKVLKSLVDDFGYQKAPYPTALDLVERLREATPLDLQYLVIDLFEEITLFANRTESATYKELPDGKYQITLNIECQKFRANEKGEETEVPIDDWIEIGAFAEPPVGQRYGATLYRKRQKIRDKESTFEFIVEELPDKVGVDPFALLIDRVPADNLKSPKPE